jgi:hypothetical protein
MAIRVEPQAEAVAAPEQLVGQPSESSVLDPPGVMEEAIRREGELLPPHRSTT